MMEVRPFDETRGANHETENKGCKNRKHSVGEFRGLDPVPGLAGVVSRQRYGKLIRTTILADGTKYAEIPEASSKARKPKRPSLPSHRRNVSAKGPVRFLSRLKAYDALLKDQRVIMVAHRHSPSH